MDGVTPPELQRARGRLDLHLCGSKIERLYQSGSAKLMLPKTYGEMTEAVMLNTAGGITGGDSLDIKLRAQDCALVATTQTAERLYRSSTAPAQISIDLIADGAAELHWLPQETIIFDGAEAARTIQLEMTADSRCLLAETMILGRQAMGEQVTGCHFTDNWRLYREGVLFHAESLRLTGRADEILAAPAGGNGARLLSTILYAGRDAEQMAGTLAPVIGACLSCCAASYWEDRMVIRLVSPHASSARTDINNILSALRQQSMPRVWQI